MSRETETEMPEAAVERESQTMPQVNHTVSYMALSAEVASLLGDGKKNVKEILRELKHLFRQNPTRIRKGRKYPREKPHAAIRLRYHRYRKRVLA